MTIHSARLFCKPCDHILIIAYYIDGKLNRDQVLFELFDCARKSHPTPIKCPLCHAEKLRFESRPTETLKSMADAFELVRSKTKCPLPTPDPMPDIMCVSMEMSLVTEGDAASN